MREQPLIVAAAVTLRAGRVMICQRRPDAHNGLKWEFPGGKLEAGESPEAALARELREELGIEARVGRVCDAIYYRYPDRDVLVLFYLCEILSGEPRTLDCNAIEWTAFEDLAGYDFAAADRAFVNRLGIG
ncbi:MAG: 8-oxo-dGTP diphosphatase MutT [Clostridia bacterium]|nr:8-oxo-dGTP diphosphatase MutT [Clostridia bacterium]